MTEPTQGPWIFKDGEIITNDDPDHPDCVLIATLANWRDESAPEQEANGHALAAAPDMYEAIEKYLSYWRGRGDKPSLDEAIEAMDAAIAKARGYDD